MGVEPDENARFISLNSKKGRKLSKTIRPMYEIFNNLTRYTKDADKAKTERTRYSKYVTK